MLHYGPQHVSSSTLLILRRTNYITTASGIVTLCKQPYSMQVESGLHLLDNILIVRSGRLWKILPPTGIRSPDLPACNESLYRTIYPGPCTYGT